MRLIVGGAYQGKKTFACELADIKEKELADGRTCAYGSWTEMKGIHHLQDYIRRMLSEDLDTARVIEEASQNPEAVIICNELGCGLVPMDALDRRYRETVGRIQCALAGQADEVYRVYCGIGEKIK